MDAPELSRLRRLCFVIVKAGAAIWLMLAAISHASVASSYVRRGPLNPTDARQLLVVGTQSSGTANTVRELSNLGLEIAHEHSDGGRVPSRDGTVSWLHGIRFLNGSAPANLTRWLCEQRHQQTGFLGPRMFIPPNQSCLAWPFSLLSRLAISLPNSDGLPGLEWTEKQFASSECWRQQCEHIVQATWGCATAGRSCAMHFRRTLLQTRHPLRTLESLAVKFCRSLQHRPSPNFAAMLQLMFPSHNWERHPSCLGALSSYIVLYLEAMLDAMKRGCDLLSATSWLAVLIPLSIIVSSRLIDGYFLVERSSACQIAKLGGFEIHEPHGSRTIPAIATCNRNRSLIKARELVNIHNQNGALLQLGHSELSKFADPQMVERLQSLSLRLGYGSLVANMRPSPHANDYARLESRRVDKSWRQNNAWRDG